MAELLFFAAAIGAILGAYGVIRDWVPFYNVLALVVHLICVAALFLLLRAEFIAAAQVVIYAGAVMVLYVFVQAYLGGAEPTLRSPFAPGLRVISIVFAGALLIELWIVLLGTGLKGVDSEGAGYEAGFGSPQDIGTALLTKFLLPFELASILLLVAVIGAVVLARRRRGAGDEELGTISVAELVRPEGSGTMREAVSGIPHAEETPQLTGGRQREPEGGW